MSHIRQPSSEMAGQMVIMKLAMQFTGDMEENIEIMSWFSRQYGMPEKVVLKIINAHWPTSATDTVH